jgi:predicted nucleic acid-binding protein
MIVLDTDVISEAMKPEPRPAVRTWLNEQVAETLYLTSVTLAEILFGIALLPAGRRRNTLTRALDGLLGLFGDRVLPFDTDAARHYTALAVAARNAGRGFPTPDGYIPRVASSSRHVTRHATRLAGSGSSTRGKADSARLSAPRS